MQNGNNFNKNYFQPNYKYTREIAEQRLVALGFSNFQFKGLSYSNGASFYFVGEDGREIRVSDHTLTGLRAFGCIQIEIEEVKKMGINRI